MENALTIGAFVFGLTQMIKETGYVKGEWLKLVAIVLGAIGTFISMYYPEMWQQLSAILIAVGVTGGVSFTNEKVSQLK